MITHLLLMLRLRMTGALCMLALYSLIVWTGKTLPLPFKGKHTVIGMSTMLYWVIT